MGVRFIAINDARIIFLAPDSWWACIDVQVEVLPDIAVLGEFSFFWIGHVGVIRTWNVYFVKTSTQRLLSLLVYFLAIVGVMIIDIWLILTVEDDLWAVHLFSAAVAIGWQVVIAPSIFNWDFTLGILTLLFLKFFDLRLILHYLPLYIAIITLTHPAGTSSHAASSSSSAKVRLRRIDFLLTQRSP